MRFTRCLKPLAVPLFTLATGMGCGSDRPNEVALPALGQVRSPLSFPAAQVCDHTENVSSTGPSLVFNNHAELVQNGGFTLEATLSAVLAGSNSNTTSAELLQSMFDAFAQSEQLHPDNGLGTMTDPRAKESALDPATFLAAMEPVALFNRVDMAPNDGANCGEHRIIYGLQPNKGINGKFTLIFEARYPNPSPEEGLLGCQPVARYWSAMESATLSDADRVELLRKFFFEGVQVNTVQLPPVVQFAHYQGEMGQIRTNQFVDSKWQLREFRTAEQGGAAVLQPDTVKGSAITELMNDASGDGLDALRAEFQESFLTEQLPLLIAPELHELSETNAILTSFGTNIESRFFDFQSDAQGTADDPSQQSSGDFKDAIQVALDAQQFPAGSKGSELEPKHILNRLGATTCGGCHQFSNNKELVPGEPGSEVKWPASLGFLHVDASGNLSPALKDVFLPARRDFLLSQLCAPKPWTLDIDNNGEYDLLTDGLLLFFEMFDMGFDSSRLGAGALRTDPQEIANYVDEGCATVLDIDGDGEACTQGDAWLVVWKLFQGSVPEHILSSTTNDNSLRKTVAELNAHLAKLTPEVAWTLDINADGTYDLMTDGFMLIAHMFETMGSSLNFNLPNSPGALRTDADDIKAYIQKGIDSGALDVNGDGVVETFTDVWMVAWYLSQGLIPQNVVDQSTNANGQRHSMAEFVVYIENLKP